MKFKKRQVQRIRVANLTTAIYDVSSVARPELIITVYAHEDDEFGSKVLGIEAVNKTTGEVQSARINLPVEDMYIIEIIEILEVDSGLLPDVKL